MSARILLVLLVAVVATACGGEAPAPQEVGDGGEATEGAASVAFVSPKDGDTVSAPAAVEMLAAPAITIEEAGEVREGAGHFHIMVDTPCVEQGQTIPSDDQHVHFGDGSTQTELELEPGEHTLCLQAGDGAHTAIGQTDEITITVE